MREVSAPRRRRKRYQPQSTQRPQSKPIGMLDCWNNGTMGLDIFIFCPSFQYSMIPFFRFSAPSRISAVWGSFFLWGSRNLSFFASLADEGKRMNEEDAESAEILFWGALGNFALTETVGMGTPFSLGLEVLPVLVSACSASSAVKFFLFREESSHR